MNVKPIVLLKENETIQHPSGILEKQITRKDLEKNPQQYVYTHPTFYANTNELKRQYAMKSNVVNGIGQNTRAQVANVKNATDQKIVFFAGIGNKNDKSISAKRNLMEMLKSKVAQNEATTAATNTKKRNSNSNK